jgi:hypothetical protein
MRNLILSLCLINLFAYFYVLFNAHVIYCKILFNYLIIIIYCFVDIGTYVGDEPTQCEDKVMEKVEDHPPVVQIPHMPRMPDMRVRLEVADELCHVMTSH